MSQGRADWNRDETLLALDLYMRDPRRSLGKRSPEVLDLCEAMDRLHEALGTPRPPGLTFRNPGSVIMKLSNFRSLDVENHLSRGKAGLRGASREDRDAWNEFGCEGGKEALRDAAAAIRDAIGRGVRLAVPFDGEGVHEAREGALLTRLHVVRERSDRLRDQRIEMARDEGRLSCEGCRFDFERTYGSHGRDYMECHHKVPLHSLSMQRTTRLDDLALVCSNCHRMIHRRRDWLDMDGLRRIVAEQAGRSMRG